MIDALKSLAIVLSFMLIFAGHGFAQKPDSPGNSGKNKAEQQSHEAVAAGKNQHFFSDDRQLVIRNYFSQARDPSHCPPGLAKKNNGCQPPGQAKKWRLGQPLPRDVVYYDLPTALLNELGQIPEGQKVVRVDTDLLLISLTTGLVIEALENLDVF